MVRLRSNTKEKNSLPYPTIKYKRGQRLSALRKSLLSYNSRKETIDQVPDIHGKQVLPALPCVGDLLPIVVDEMQEKSKKEPLIADSASFSKSLSLIRAESGRLPTIGGQPPIPLYFCNPD